ARGPSAALMTKGCGFFSVKTWMAFTWSAGVMGLSTVTVQGTVLPFSTRGGMSSLTLPSLIRASPTTVATAACISAGVAFAGPTSREATVQPTARLPAILSASRRVAVLRCPALNVMALLHPLLFAQRCQERHDILDLPGRQHRLAAERRRHPVKAL